MRKAGIHDFVTMAITGHKTMEMFQRYNTVDEADLNTAIQKHSIKILSLQKPSNTCHAKCHMEEWGRFGIP